MPFFAMFERMEWEHCGNLNRGRGFRTYLLKNAMESQGTAAVSPIQLQVHIEESRSVENILAMLHRRLIYN